MKIKSLRFHNKECIILDWSWDIYDEGSASIYYKGQLMWELDFDPKLMEREINILIKEFIFQNQHIIREDDD